jgi:hypothetical protein
LRCSSSRSWRGVLSLRLPQALQRRTGGILPPGVPEYVSEVIARGQPPSAEREPSFIDIIETLKKNDFRIPRKLTPTKSSPSSVALNQRRSPVNRSKATAIQVVIRCRHPFPVCTAQLSPPPCPPATLELSKHGAPPHTPASPKAAQS